MKPKHLENRMKLIKKIAKNEDYEPTKEELHKAYGYLSYCLSCGKKIRTFEPFRLFLRSLSASIVFEIT